MKSHVRAVPRAKHEHRWTRTVRISGSRQRYGCGDCPAVDPYWYRIPGVSVGPAQVAPKRRGIVCGVNPRREGFEAPSRAAQAAEDAMLPHRAGSGRGADLSGLSRSAQRAIDTMGELGKHLPVTSAALKVMAQAAEDADMIVSMKPAVRNQPSLMIGRAQTPPPLPAEPDHANVKDAKPGRVVPKVDGMPFGSVEELNTLKIVELRSYGKNEYGLTWNSKAKKSEIVADIDRARQSREKDSE